jgi:hypothetical protein
MQKARTTPSTVPIKPKPSKLPACRIDFSVICPHCQVQMTPVHSHYQCMKCGWRDSCCF